MWYSVFKHAKETVEHWSASFPTGQRVRKIGRYTGEWRGRVHYVDHVNGVIWMYWEWDDRQVIFPINRWEVIPA